MRRRIGESLCVLEILWWLGVSRVVRVGDKVVVSGGELVVNWEEGVIDREGE